MSRAKHTPGPWTLPHFAVDNAGCDCGYVLSEHSQGPSALAQVFYSPHDREAEPLEVAQANARLIAAAPDLLEALSAIVDGLDWELLTEGDHARERVERHQRLLAAAEAAIAKAEGQS